VSLATVGDMADRTITINGLSKTYSATGWRVGWAIAPKTVANAMRRVHDFLTVGAPHPLQIATVAALDLPESYYRGLARSYESKRDTFVRGLHDAGLDCRAPSGAYYVMTDISHFPFSDDWAFAMHLVERLRVAVVPGSSFYGDPKDGQRFVRFMFSKRDETLKEAIDRLRGLRDVR
jgi:aminotransferase